jgi:hypothetical protein
MNKEQVDRLNIVPARRAGNSTRIIDALIQELFTTGKCGVWDHAGRVGNFALDHTLRILVERLYREHNMNKNRDYNLDRKEMVITLIRHELATHPSPEQTAPQPQENPPSQDES